MTERATYISFLSLAIEWADVSGMPKEMVLRNMCHWAMAEAFPPGALVQATGKVVDVFDIYMSFRAATETTPLSGGISLNGKTYLSPGDRWGMHVLAEVLIGSQDVAAFCEMTKTLPPPSLLSGWRRYLTQREGRSLAPPACPDALEYASRRDARDSATGTINRMRAIIDGFQGKRTAFGPLNNGGPVDFVHWAKDWSKTKAHAESNLKICGDPELQSELDSLDARWQAFMQAGQPDEIPEERPSTAPSISPNISEPKKARGRPAGSGSLETADAALVAQMREIIEQDQTISPTAAAIRLANQAAGGGTPDSKAKRLTERYFKQYGRPAS